MQRNQITFDIKLDTRFVLDQLYNDVGLEIAVRDYAPTLFDDSTVMVVNGTITNINVKTKRVQLFKTCRENFVVNVSKCTKIDPVLYE